MEMKIQNDKKKEVLTKAIITFRNCGFQKKGNNADRCFHHEFLKSFRHNSSFCKPSRII